MVAIEAPFSHYLTGEQSFLGRAKHEGGPAGGPNERCSPGNPKPSQKELHMRGKWLRQLSCMLALLTATFAAQAEDLYLKKSISVGGNIVSSTETSIKGARTRDVNQGPRGIPDIDAQGRFLEAQFGALSVVSLYMPSGTMGEPIVTIPSSSSCTS